MTLTDLSLSAIAEFLVMLTRDIAVLVTAKNAVLFFIHTFTLPLGAALLYTVYFAMFQPTVWSRLPHA